MDWQKFAQQYVLSYTISPKQKDYIINACAILNSQLWSKLTSILSRDIHTWSDLTKADVNIIIKTLKRESPLTTYQLQQIQAKYTLQQISTILKKDIEWSQLTYNHYIQLDYDPQRFRLVCQDHPQYVTEDYEYGWQTSKYCKNNEMWYLKFYNLCMIDYDNITLADIEKILAEFKTEVFRIYQTHNGYHVFVISRLIEYNDPFMLEFMERMQADEYYRRFSHKYGYKVRLSPKIDREEKFLACYVKTIGRDEDKDADCWELAKVHDAYIRARQKEEYNEGLL